MKTILILTISLIFTGCAIAHKRGPDTQAVVDHYVQNRGTLPNELTKNVNLQDVKEAYVTVQWTVTDKGLVKDVTIYNDTLHNDIVNTMIVEHLKHMQFPKQPNFTTTTVEYTYKFRSEETKKK